MTYDFPAVKGALEPLPRTAAVAVIALVIASGFVIIDGYSRIRAGTDCFIELPLHASPATARQRSDNSAVT